MLSCCLLIYVLNPVPIESPVNLSLVSISPFSNAFLITRGVLGDLILRDDFPWGRIMLRPKVRHTVSLSINLPIGDRMHHLDNGLTRPVLDVFAVLGWLTASADQRGDRVQGEDASELG